MVALKEMTDEQFERIRSNCCKKSSALMGWLASRALIVLAPAITPATGTSGWME